MKINLRVDIMDLHSVVEAQAFLQVHYELLIEERSLSDKNTPPFIPLVTEQEVETISRRVANEPITDHPHPIKPEDLININPKPKPYPSETPTSKEDAPSQPLGWTYLKSELLSKMRIAKKLVGPDKVHEDFTSRGWKTQLSRNKDSDLTPISNYLDIILGEAPETPANTSQTTTPVESKKKKAPPTKTTPVESELDFM